MGLRPFPNTWRTSSGDPLQYLDTDKVNKYEIPILQRLFSHSGRRSSWEKDTNGLSINHLINVYDPGVPGLQQRLLSFEYKPGNDMYFSFGFYDKNGERFGHLVRHVEFDREFMDMNGNKQLIPFKAHNSSFFIEPEYQGLGIANRIYPKQEEELFRPLAKHPGSYVTVEANGDVGRYAWALKGFDFKNTSYIDDYLDYLAKLKGFEGSSELNDLNRLLLKDTGKGISDLKHSWDFAMLDDGKQYDIMTNKGSGKGHLGKKLMLETLGSWYGIKLLHPDSIHNKVANIWEQAKQKKQVI